MADETKPAPAAEKQPASAFVHLLDNSLYLGDAWVAANAPKRDGAPWGTVKVGETDREAPNGFLVVRAGERMSNELWRGDDAAKPFDADPHPSLVILGRATPAA